MFNYCMITAGGKGERLLPLTQYIHKAMLQVNGATIIAGLIRQIKATIGNISVTVGHKGNELAKHAIEEGVSAIYNTSQQSDAWWLFNTPLRHVNEPVIVFACDLVVRDLQLDFIYRSYLEQGEPACMLVPVTPVPDVTGDFITGSNGLVTTLSRTPPTGLLASGIFVINPFRINALLQNADNINQIWDLLVRIGQLHHSSLYPGSWSTVNTIEQLEAVQQPSTQKIAI